MGLVVIDRELLESERQAIGRRETLDLTKGPAAAQSSLFRKAILDWFDAINTTHFDGHTPYDFFRLRGHSYWLHARFSLFMDLYGDAQLLDTLPDPGLPASVETVYCSGLSRGFWQRWTPQATLHSTPTDQHDARPEAVLGTFLLRLARRLPGVLSHGRRRKHFPPQNLFFSASANNVKQQGMLRDRQFGPLLDRLDRADVLRVEFIPLPNAGLSRQAHVDLQTERANPTVSTDVLLIRALLRRPSLALQLRKNLLYCRRRFSVALNHDWEFPFGNDRWHRLLAASIARLAPSVAVWDLYRSVFRRYLSGVNPRYACISSEANNVGRVFTEECKRAGIPAVGYQHGAIAPHNVDYRYDTSDVPHGIPDHMAVWSEPTRDYLVGQSHYPPDRVHVVGRLLNDEIRQPVPDATIRAFREREDRPVLLFASQPQQNERSREETARLLAHFCRANGISCAVRLHPREPDDGLYESAFREVSIASDLIKTSGNLHASIVACDFGGTCFSTVAWEIMHLRVPLIVFDPLHLNLLDLRQTPSVFHADRPVPSFEEWTRSLDTWIDENYRLAVNVLGPDDGGNCDRMLEVLQQLSREPE